VIDLALGKNGHIRMRALMSKRTKGPRQAEEWGSGRPPITSITEHQRRTLREIRDYIARKGYPPTI